VRKTLQKVLLWALQQFAVRNYQAKRYRSRHRTTWPCVEHWKARAFSSLMRMAAALACDCVSPLGKVGSDQKSSEEFAGVRGHERISSERGQKACQARLSIHSMIVTPKCGLSTSQRDSRHAGAW
jgi:hypothetical protein